MAAGQFTKIAHDLGLLQVRVHGSNGIITRLQRAEDYLSQASDLLKLFPDEPAARALQHASTALEQLRNATCGSLTDFVDTSTELQSRIKRL